MNENYSFSNGLANKDNAYIDKRGNIVIKPDNVNDRDFVARAGGNYIFENSFSEGLAVIRVWLGRMTYKYGCIDTKGNLVIQPLYDYISPFSEGLAAITVDGYCGYIDMQGHIAIQPAFKEASSFSEGLAAVRTENGNLVFIDRTGNITIKQTKNLIVTHDNFIPHKAEFKEARQFHDGLSICLCENMNGIINKSGHFFKTVFREIGDYSEGMAYFSVYDNTAGILYGFINKDRDIVINPQFHDVSDFHEGLSAIRIDRLYGYIDPFGNVVIPCLYREAMQFKEGLAAVRLNDKVGFIDKTGRMVIPPMYDSAQNFSEGLAAVKMSGVWRYIDKSGHAAF